VLDALFDAWRNRRDELDGTLEEVYRVLGELARPRPLSQDTTFDDDRLIRLTDEAARDYDPRHGGFGRAPKFPQQTLLALLLGAQHAFAKDNEGWERQIRHTLDAMADGGIRDHLGGGFHRYSTDAKWLVPHFEIMLYDQAMLAGCYIEAFRQFEDRRYADVARRCLDFVLREMADGTGAFYTAFDAEVDAKEGGSYLWTPDEVRQVLGEADAAVFNRIYGLDRGFNFADPHGPNPESPDANVLFLAEPARESDADVAAMREKLLSARRERDQPMLDDKIVTSWNGLMISALADAADILQERRYLDAATRSADWLLRHHWDGKRLARSSRHGQVAPGEGTLDDYAHLARGCCSIWRAGGNTQWREHAALLMLPLETRFRHPDGGFCTTANDDPDRRLMGGIGRRVATDTPLPAGNALAAEVLLDLNRPDDAREILATFAGVMNDLPGGASTMLDVAIRYGERVGDFDVKAHQPVDDPATPEAQANAAVEVAADWNGPQNLTLTLGVAQGFHLYAPGHAGQERAVEVFGDTVSKVTIADPGDGRLVGQVPVEIELSEPATESGVDLSVAYQACDTTRCLLPVRKTFKVGPPVEAN
jgi:uncharacterized protein YyaL (SSP411 family)